MPLPMQGKKLLPGVQNVGRRRLLARPPDRRRGDVALDAREELGAAEAAEFGGKFHARSPLVGAEAAAALVAGLGGKPVGKGIDQRRLEPAGVGMAEFSFGEFLEAVVQQPWVVER